MNGVSPSPSTDQKKIYDPPKSVGIIFDFNGVMVDDYPLQKEAWSQISLKLRKTEVTDEEMVKKIRGVP